MLIYIVLPFLFTNSNKFLGIRNLLLESESHECPGCHKLDVSPDSLIPNRFLRIEVSKFKKEHMLKMAEVAAGTLSAPQATPDNLTPTETQPEEIKKAEDVGASISTNVSSETTTSTNTTTTTTTTTTNDTNKDKFKESGLIDLKNIDIDELYDKVAFEDSEPQFYDEEIDKKER